MTWYADYTRPEDLPSSVLPATVVLWAEDRESAIAEAEGYQAMRGPEGNPNWEKEMDGLSEEIKAKVAADCAAWQLIGVRHDDKPRPHWMHLAAKAQRIPIGSVIKVKRPRDPDDRIGGGSLNPEANLVGFAATLIRDVASRGLVTTYGQLMEVDLNINYARIVLRERVGRLRGRWAAPQRIVLQDGLFGEDVVDIEPA
jgi:hypothetical protein